MANTKNLAARRAYTCALATALHLLATGCDGGVEVSINITSPSPEPPCGDGEIGPGEECDDGAANGNGAACKLDCPLNVCGDGHVGPGESCDDGNDVDGDDCSNTCVGSVCGDGAVQPGEACDDGNKSKAALAKHPRSRASSLPGPIRCLAGVARSPPQPGRARFAVATTPVGAFSAT